MIQRWLLIISITILLILHLKRIVIVDLNTIYLLLIIVSIVLWGDLEELKIGDWFEGKKIKQEKIEKIEAEAENLPNTGNKDDTNYFHDIKEIFKKDHILALAKIRMDLDKSLLQLSSEPEKISHMSLRRIAVKLADQNLIDKSYIPAIHDIATVCNQAIHGKEIDNRSAEIIIDIGTDVITYLRSELKKKNL